MIRISSKTRGYSMLEVVTVVMISGMAAYGLATFLDSARNIEREGRSDVLVERELRSGLLSIADTLRNVPESELGGFDKTDQSTRPTFKRIVGAKDGAPTLGSGSYLEWRASRGGRSDDPGGIYLVVGTTATLLARQVTPGSFKVRHEGANLRIELEARQATGDGDKVRTRKGEIVIALRN